MNECYGVDCYNAALTGNKSSCLRSIATDVTHTGAVLYSVENHPNDSRVQMRTDGTVQTLSSRMGTGGGNVPLILEKKENGEMNDTAVCVGNGQLDQARLSKSVGALNCMHDQQAILTTGKSSRKYIVRRLTPLECCRLQGFPDWWEEGVPGSDSARYKMWGNGMALPNMLHVMQGIARLAQSEQQDLTDDVFGE